MQDIVRAAGGEPSNLNLFHTSTQRYSNEAEQNISKQVAPDWEFLLVANIHSNGKLMDNLDRSNTIKCLPVL